jgi:uncharacterized membrane protein YhfC
MKTSRWIITAIALLILVLVAVFLISNPKAIPPLLGAIIMLAAPIYLGVLIAKKLGADWNIYAVGAATWGITFVLHLVFNAWVLEPIMENLGLSTATTGMSLLWTGVLLGLAAGVFEETGRYLVYARFLPNTRKWSEGLMLGAGHGGFESIFFGAWVLYIFLQMVVLKESSPGQLAVLVSPEKLEVTMAQIAVYWNTPWYEMFLGSFERINAIVIHLSMSLMVLAAFRRKNILWFFASVLWHTITNAVAVYSVVTWGALTTEGLLFLIALLSIGIIIALQRRYPEPKELVSEEPLPPTPLLSTPEKVILTTEKLDDSRYD